MTFMPAAPTVHLLHNMQPRCGRKGRGRVLCTRHAERVTCRFCLRLIGGAKPFSKPFSRRGDP